MKENKKKKPTDDGDTLKGDFCGFKDLNSTEIEFNNNLSES